MPNKWTLSVSLVFNLVLVLMLGVTLGNHVVYVPQASKVPLTRSMQPIEINPTWIKAGNPTFAAAQTTVIRHPGGSLTTGQWYCEGPATFEWTYEVDETIHILDGEAQIEYQGSQLTLGAGDTAFFQQGTKATWTVPNNVYKSFVLHDIGPFARLYRRFLARWIE